MKYVTFDVSSRTSVSPWSEYGCAVTSSHSCSASLVVPVPTNWRDCCPLEPPPLCGCCTWLAKLSFSVSGLNCTGTGCEPGARSSSVESSSCSWAFSSLTGSGTGRLPQGEPLVRELQLLH